MIIFADLNVKLCNMIKDLNLTNVIVRPQNVSQVKSLYPLAKIVTASNPKFTAGGGLDACLKKWYPFQWEKACSGFMSEDLFFVITCDSSIRTNENIIRTALYEVKGMSCDFDLILTGIGTGIAGLSEDCFVRLFKEVFGEVEEK